MNFIQGYEQAIEAIVRLAFNQDKVAHICAGMTIWLATALIGKKSLSSPWPLFWVFLAESANEVADRIAHGSWRWSDTAGDIVATVFWPCIVAAVVQFQRRRAR